MTKRQDFIKKKCKNNHCSPMSNQAWCDLNSKGDILKLRDHCSNLKCKCQKQIIFTPQQFQLEQSGFKITTAKLFKGSKKAKKN